MIQGHYDLVCPQCGVRMGGCRCLGHNKAKRKHTEPCKECQVDNLFNAVWGEPQEEKIPYELEADKDRLTDRALTKMAQDASWHGSVGQGEHPSIDRELASGNRLRNHVEILVAEVRRLRALVPPDQRIPPVPEPRYKRGPKPPPPPL